MTDDDATGNDNIQEQLDQIRRDLQLLQAAVIVSAAILRRQRGDRDDEFVRMLLYGVGSRVAAQLERVARIVALLRPHDPDPDEPPAGPLH